LRSRYKPIGEFIRQVNVRNDGKEIDLLLGVNLDKKFFPSVANINGTDLSNYKKIKKGQFGCKLMSVGRDMKLPISRLTDHTEAIISSAYFVFEVNDENKLLPEYLMMWFSRAESDRYLWFQSGGDVRGRITWEDLCSLPIKVPALEKQRDIVAEYNTITNRIALNEQLNQKLEETAQALYKHWFVDFEFPNVDGKPYKSNGGEMVWSDELDKEIPVGWEVLKVKNFTKEMRSGGTPNRSVETYWESKDIPWIKTGELNNSVLIDAEEYISNLGLKESSAKLLPVNAVLVAMYGEGETKGTVGYLKTPGTTNQACCAMICKDEKHSSFLYYHFRFNREEIVSIAIGGAQPNLSKGIIEDVVIVNPTVVVMKNHPFVEILAHKECIQREIYALKKIKELLLSKMSKVELNMEIV
jgi:type I restriction enzyme S subunit